MRSWRSTTTVLVAAAIVATACGGDGEPTTAADARKGVSEGDGEGSAPTEQTLLEEDEQVGVGEDQADLLGAGATFITPLMLEWIRDNEPGVDVNYQSIGSGGGIEQFLSQNVDFGSTERYLTDEEVAEAEEIRGCEALHIPDAFGSVVVSYNDPELEAALDDAGQDRLVLDGPTTAGIFATDIETWNDPAIQELNPDVDLPDTTLVPVHRSDGSGTTYIFTTYLASESEAWAQAFGNDSEVDWAPGTVGGNGNEGVAAETQQQPGAVGYLSYAYAIENDIATTSLVNDDGNVVEPTLGSISAGPNEVIDTIPDDFRYDITGVGGEGFPSVGTHWILAWECGYDDEVADALKKFLTWAVTDGDGLAEDLHYPPVSGDFQERVLEQIERIDSVE